MKSVKMTSDVSESGVKMISDFPEIPTKDDQTRVLLVRGVERHWYQFPNFRKQTPNSEF